MVNLAQAAKLNPKAWISRGLAVARPKIFLLGLFCLSSAWADIYAYTDNGGMVYLSNAPTSKRYQVLVSNPREHTEEAPLSATKKTSPGLAKKLKYDRIVEEVALIYGLDSALVHAVISVESRYNPDAVSKKGASGLMQLMPGTARHYGVIDALDPVQNLHGGAKYLRDMLFLFNGDMSLAVAAYNAGESAVVRHGNRIPPFRETMNYVPKVLNFYREYRADRPRHSEAFVVKGEARSRMPSRALPPNLDNARGHAFPPRENL